MKLPGSMQGSESCSKYPPTFLNPLCHNSTGNEPAAGTGFLCSSSQTHKDVGSVHRLHFLDVQAEPLLESTADSNLFILPLYLPLTSWELRVISCIPNQAKIELLEN